MSAGKPLEKFRESVEVLSNGSRLRKNRKERENFLGLQEEDIRGNQDHKPPDAEQKRDPEVKEESCGKEPPSDPKGSDPETKGDEELETFDEIGQMIIERKREIPPEDLVRKRCCPSPHEALHEDHATLPIGEDHLLPTDAKIGRRNLERQDPLRQDRNGFGSKPRSLFDAHGEGECSVGAAAGHNQKTEDEEPIKRCPKQMQGKHPVVEGEQKSNERSNSRKKTDGEEKKSKKKYRKYPSSAVRRWDDQGPRDE